MNKWTHRLQISRRLSLKYFYKAFGNVNTWFQNKEWYAIKKGYHHASSAGSFNDTSNTDEWQKEVYQFASDFMKRHGYHRVTDVGCGSAYKLLHYFDQYDTTGIEVKNIHDWLTKTYPSKKWLQIEKIRPSEISTDLIICSDVIEHIPDPDILLQLIRAIDCKHIIISTPERDIVAGKNDFGPPENVSHYREWNSKEFKNYLSRWFIIEDHQIFAGRSPSQVVVCKK